MFKKIFLLLIFFLYFSIYSFSEIITLDGEWDIIFDELNESNNKSLYLESNFKKYNFKQKISVPSCWETIKKDYEGVAVYGKYFLAPNSLSNKIVKLQFDAVNYRSEVWINNHPVGAHEGGYGPFEFKINDLLNIGKTNFISVRVLGPIVNQDKIIDGLGKNDAPHWRGAIAGGIWQSVRLRSSGDVSIEDIFIKPDISNNSIEVELELFNHNMKHLQENVDFKIHDSNNEIVLKNSFSLSLQPGKNTSKYTFLIPNAERWSPSNPHLYNFSANVNMKDEEIIRFGLRELSIKDNQFVLNNNPIYIKAAFFEGLYPTKLAIPDSKEMAIKEITLAKEAGFNMIRPWRKPPPKMWLDLCDELGMMVIGGMPIECMKLWPSVTPDTPRRIKHEVSSSILRDRNRACIVQWEIFNEIWRKELKRLKHSMSMLARDLDPTRLILDESGGFADGANIYLPYQYEPLTFNDVHIYCGYPINDLTYAQFLALGLTKNEMEKLGYSSSELENKHSTPNKMTIVSEIGYGSIPNLPKNNMLFKNKGNSITPPYRYHSMLEESLKNSLFESKLDTLYSDLETFCDEQQQLHANANKQIIEAIRLNTNVQGYCVHALTGGDWVLGAGLLDLWRNKKLSYDSTKFANANQYLAIRTNPRNVYANQGTKFQIKGINDDDDIPNGILKIDIINESNRIVKSWTKKIGLNSGVSSLFDTYLDTSKWSGRYKVKTFFISSGKQISSNEYSFNVFNQKELQSPEISIAIIDPENLIKPFLRQNNIQFTEFGKDTAVSTPVFISSAKKNLPIFKELHQFVDMGGIAVFLEIFNQPGRSYWSTKLPPKGVLPFNIEKKHALGLWVGVSHIVKKHPIFDGLEVDCMMTDLYQNVWTPFTMGSMDGEHIVTSITHGFYGGKDHEKQCYLGPEPFFHGMDMGIVEYGSGKYILSALRITPFLSKDPVADKIFINILNYLRK